MIGEKKEKFYEFKYSDNKNSDPKGANNNGKTKEKYPNDTAFIMGDSILNSFIQERFSRKGRAVKMHNTRDATVDDMKHHFIPLLRK